MTIQDRIIAHLGDHPEGVDDDALTAALGLRQRQQANMRCRRLEEFGFVVRRRTEGKILNFLASPLPASPLQGQVSVRDCTEQPWYWEGNVQSAVVRQLESAGYQISFAANTATKEQGKDIIAISPSGTILWISAKGFPRGTVKTNARTQARHWFSHALFDLVLWRGEHHLNGLGLAFPEQPTYRRLVSRIHWFLETAGASIFWVAEDGSVTVQAWPLISRHTAE
jgi:hypothetical protein